MKEEQFETGRGKMGREFIPPKRGRAWGMLQILELGCYPDFETQTVTAGVLYNSMFVCECVCVHSVSAIFLIISLLSQAFLFLFFSLHLM